MAVGAVALVWTICFLLLVWIFNCQIGFAETRPAEQTAAACEVVVPGGNWGLSSKKSKGAVGASAGLILLGTGLR